MEIIGGITSLNVFMVGVINLSPIRLRSSLSWLQLAQIYVSDANVFIQCNTCEGIVLGILVMEF
jgi:hypothetical protein